MRVSFTLSFSLLLAFFLATCASQCTTITGLTNSASSGDNLSAIQTAVSNVAVGGCLQFPSGTFRITNNINVERFNITVRGAGSDKTVLLMVNPSTAGWRVFSDNHTLTGLTIKVLGASGRGDQNQQGMSTLLLDGRVNRGNGLGCSGFYGYDLILDGAKAAAFFAYNASHYTLRRVYAKNSLADSFHNTGGSNYGSFYDCRSKNGGDDMMAFVWYDGRDSGEASHHMNVVRFQGFGNTHGRGLANINCHNIYVEDIYLEKTSAAGIIIAREKYGDTTARQPAYSTRIVKSAQGSNRVEGCNYGAEDHGSVFFYNIDSTNQIYDISLNDIDIVDSNLGRSAGFSSGSVFLIDRGIIKTNMTRFTFYGTQPNNRFARSTPFTGSVVNRVGWDESKIGTRPTAYPYALERDGFVYTSTSTSSSTSSKSSSKASSSLAVATNNNIEPSEDNASERVTAQSASSSISFGIVTVLTTFLFLY